MSLKNTVLDGFNGFNIHQKPLNLGNLLQFLIATHQPAVETQGHTIKSYDRKRKGEKYLPRWERKKEKYLQRGRKKAVEGRYRNMPIERGRKGALLPLHRDTNHTTYLTEKVARRQQCDLERVSMDTIHTQRTQVQCM